MDDSMHARNKTKSSIVRKLGMASLLILGLSGCQYEYVVTGTSVAPMKLNQFSIKNDKINVFMESKALTQEKVSLSTECPDWRNKAIKDKVYMVKINHYEAVGKEGDIRTTSKIDRVALQEQLCGGFISSVIEDKPTLSDSNSEIKAASGHMTISEMNAVVGAAVSTVKADKITS